MDKSPTTQRPLIIGVGGFTSEIGKTTLLCDLLRAFPGSEAIKTTRGHYRSCGKDPEACCVSHLLEDRAVVRSGRALTYTAGKDTGRYWDSGAVNVHWVIATDQQVEEGINEALSRVSCRVVLVEGNSFTKFVAPDFFVMVVRSRELKIKTTAVQSLHRVSAYYISDNTDAGAKELVYECVMEKTRRPDSEIPPIFLQNDIPQLIRSIQAQSALVAA